MRREWTEHQTPGRTERIRKPQLEARNLMFRDSAGRNLDGCRRRARRGAPCFFRLTDSVSQRRGRSSTTVTSWWFPPVTARASELATGLEPIVTGDLSSPHLLG